MSFAKQAISEYMGWIVNGEKVYRLINSIININSRFHMCYVMHMHAWFCRQYSLILSYYQSWKAEGTLVLNGLRRYHDCMHVKSMQWQIWLYMHWFPCMQGVDLKGLKHILFPVHCLRHWVLVVCLLIFNVMQMD